MPSSGVNTEWCWHHRKAISVNRNWCFSYEYVGIVSVRWKRTVTWKEVKILTAMGLRWFRASKYALFRYRALYILPMLLLGSKRPPVGASASGAAILPAKKPPLGNQRRVVSAHATYIVKGSDGMLTREGCRSRCGYRTCGSTAQARTPSRE